MYANWFFLSFFLYLDLISFLYLGVVTFSFVLSELTHGQIMSLEEASSALRFCWEWEHCARRSEWMISLLDLVEIFHKRTLIDWIVILKALALYHV
jgi:hypothetical protein